MTLAELRGILSYRLQDISYYTDTEIDNALNRAIRDTQLMSRCHRTVTTISLSAGTATYNICGTASHAVFEPIELVVT